MRIERVDPVDADVIRACHAVHAAAQAADDPQEEPPLSLAMFSAYVRHDWPGHPPETWYVPGDSPGQAVACCYLELPDLENRDRAFVNLTVHPAFRRRGLGGALARHAAQRAGAGGRSVLDTVVVRGSAGEAFARRLGAEPGIGDARRVVDLRKAEADRFAELRATAAGHAAGYSLIRWTGATPAEERARVAGVRNAMNDAPREEGWFEDDIWDADRVRDRADTRVRFGGNRGYTVAATHDATGEMAALTQVFVDPAYPEWGHQGITAVTRPHRGHRLGLLTKAAMLDWLVTAEPQLERIATTNAEPNAHMIAVNEALGYELAEPGFLFFALPVSPVSPVS
jgi:RimJ/RimL family protein N-acetyltransferase